VSAVLNDARRGSTVYPAWWGYAGCWWTCPTGSATCSTPSRRCAGWLRRCPTAPLPWPSRSRSCPSRGWRVSPRWRARRRRGGGGGGPPGGGGWGWRWRPATPPGPSSSWPPPARPDGWRAAVEAQRSSVSRPFPWTAVFTSATTWTAPSPRWGSPPPRTGCSAWDSQRRCGGTGSVGGNGLPVGHRWRPCCPGRATTRPSGTRRQRTARWRGACWGAAWCRWYWGGPATRSSSRPCPGSRGYAWPPSRSPWISRPPCWQRATWRWATTPVSPTWRRRWGAPRWRSTAPRIPPAPRRWAAPPCSWPAPSAPPRAGIRCLRARWRRWPRHWRDARHLQRSRRRGIMPVAVGR